MLKISKDDPGAERKELEFSIMCSLSYTLAQRIHKMLELSQRILKLAKKYEDRKPYQIIKRPIR